MSPLARSRHIPIRYTRCISCGARTPACPKCGGDDHCFQHKHITVFPVFGVSSIPGKDAT